MTEEVMIVELTLYPSQMIDVQIAEDLELIEELYLAVKYNRT